MTYSIKETGIQGFDYSRMKGFEIIPVTNLSQSDTFIVLPNKIVEARKQNTITLDSSSLYTTFSTSQNVIIEDCLPLGLNESSIENNTFNIYPNPTFENLNITQMNNSISKPQVFIFNEIGRLVKKTELLQTNHIHISDLPNGFYFIKLSNYPNQVQKFLKM